MNYALKHALLLPLFCLFSALTLTAQPYTEGQYQMGFQSIEVLSDTVDTEMIAYARKLFLSERYGVAFRGDTVAFTVQDTFGEINTRMVISLLEQSVVAFNYNALGTIYDTVAYEAALPLLSSSTMMLSVMEVDSIGETEVDIKGLPCRYARFVDEQGHFEAYLTSKIGWLQYLDKPAGELSLLDTMSVVKFIDKDQNLAVTFALDTFYSEVKNPEWFSAEPPRESISTKELEKIQLLTEDVLESFNEEPDKGQGVNLHLAARLDAKGLTPEYWYRDMVDQQRSIDRFELIADAITYYESTDFDSLLSVLQETEILALEEVTDLSERISNIPELDIFRFKDMVKVWMLKDMLADPEHRQMFVRNLEQLDCYDINDEIRAKGEAYAKGELPLVAYITSLPQFHPLPRQGQWLHKDELPELITYLIAAAVPELKSEIDLDIRQEEGKQRYIIRTADEVYRLPVGFLGQEGDSIATGRTDSILIDKMVYDPIIKVIKQIITDKGLKRVCALESIDNHLPGYLYRENYDWVIAQQPDLKLFDHPYYLNVFPEGKYDWLDCDIPISFPLEQEQPQQAKFRDLISDDFSEYLPSSNKRNYIAFLRQQQQGLGMSTADIDALEDDIMERLVLNIQALIKAIPDIHLTLGILDEWRPASLDGQPTFEKAFPRISRLLGGKFEAENLRPGETEDILLLMDAKGKTIKVKAKDSYAHPEKEGLMQAIQPFLADQQMGIFTLFTLSKERTYYLLTYEQRKALEEIFEIRFIRV